MRVFLESGRKIELVNSEVLCSILDISKPETLINMARRGDLPEPIYLNTANRKKRGRNIVRWNLPDVITLLGIDHS